MSLIELLWLTFLILSAFFVGNFLAHRLGTAGWWIGVPAGVFLWVSITVGLLKMSRLYDRLFPIRPVCRQKKCVAKDYSLLEITKQGVLFRCRCGDTYLKKGNRFGELLGDGSVRRYMIRSPFRDWRPDSPD